MTEQGYCQKWRRYSDGQIDVVIPTPGKIDPHIGLEVPELTKKWLYLVEYPVVDC